MSETLQRTSMVHPASGEVVALDGTTDRLALHLDYTRDLERQLREFKQAVTDELLRRMDEQATWTAHLPNGITLTGDSPAPAIDVDVPALQATLKGLVETGQIVEAASLAALEPVTSYKVRRAGLNALKKLGGTIKTAVEACEHEAPKQRRVSVKRTP